MCVCVCGYSYFYVHSVMSCNITYFRSNLLCDLYYCYYYYYIFWWSPLIPSRNFDEVLTYNQMSLRSLSHI